jgi:predicted DNA-binding transcriptional regulator YafY
MSTTATRLITLIMLLQRRPGQKAAHLAQELGVSVRTLHRYMTMLDDMGIPIYSERGPYGGFSLVRGYKMPPLIFSPEEAVAVYLGTSLVREMWGQVYHQAALGALAKLDNVLPDDQRHEVAWAQRTLFATGLHRGDLTPLEPILDKLRRGARERRRVTMLYRSRGQVDPLQRQVDPYALIHRWGWWYLVGHCHLRDAVRTFRVDRILELTLLDRPFDLPTKFDIHQYLAAEPPLVPHTHARLRFQPEAALIALDNRANWDTLEEHTDGSVTVSFGAPSLEWAASAVLAYGPHVVALEPRELRRMVSEWSRAIAEQYSSPAQAGHRRRLADIASTSMAEDATLK